MFNVGCIAIELHSLPALASGKNEVRLCGGKLKAGYANCNIHAKTDSANHPLIASVAQGFTPKDILSAYNLSGHAKNKQIVAIVDAYDDPTVQKDLDFIAKLLTWQNYLFVR